MKWLSAANGYLFFATGISAIMTINWGTIASYVVDSEVGPVGFWILSLVFIAITYSIIRAFDYHDKG